MLKTRKKIEVEIDPNYKKRRRKELKEEIFEIIKQLEEKQIELSILNSNTGDKNGI